MAPINLEFLEFFVTYLEENYYWNAKKVANAYRSLFYDVMSINHQRDKHLTELELKIRDTPFEKQISAILTWLRRYNYMKKGEFRYNTKTYFSDPKFTRGVVVYIRNQMRRPDVEFLITLKPYMVDDIYKRLERRLIYDEE